MNPSWTGISVQTHSKGAEDETYVYILQLYVELPSEERRGQLRWNQISVHLQTQNKTRTVTVKRNSQTRALDTFNLEVIVASVVTKLASLHSTHHHFSKKQT
jgi:hypothetical protein